MLSDYDPARKYFFFFRRNVPPSLGDMFYALLEWAVAVMVTEKGGGHAGAGEPPGGGEW